MKQLIIAKVTGPPIEKCPDIPSQQRKMNVYFRPPGAKNNSLVPGCNILLFYSIKMYTMIRVRVSQHFRVQTRSTVALLVRTRFCSVFKVQVIFLTSTH